MDSPNTHSSITSADWQPYPYLNSRRSPGTSSGGRAGPSSGTNAACAACKYQRRKCNPDCVLAQYFPADQQQLFLNAHRLFGVSNILKTIRGLSPEKTRIAMRNITVQSNMKANDPTGGCFRSIHGLLQKIEVAKKLHERAVLELERLRQPVGNVALALNQIPEQNEGQYYCNVMQNHDGFDIDAAPSSPFLLFDMGQDLQQDFMDEKVLADLCGIDNSQANDFFSDCSRDLDQKVHMPQEYSLGKLETSVDAADFITKLEDQDTKMEPYL